MLPVKMDATFEVFGMLDNVIRKFDATRKLAHICVCREISSPWRRPQLFGLRFTQVCLRVVQKLKNGAPGAIPTRDLPLRRRTLYAAELREHKSEVIVNGKS